MKLLETTIPDILLIETDVYRDGRGFFQETYHVQKYEALGISGRFVQDNHSKSVAGTLRGLHFQHPHGQGKLVRVTQGEVYDVAVDIRVGSPTFGKWFGTILSAENMRQIFIPAGFAHGYCVLRETAEFQYKCTDFYAPDCEQGILWNDPQLSIEWPITKPLLSAKDSAYPRLTQISAEKLPKYKA